MVGTMDAGSALSLRERKKLDTRRALSDAALALAFENGLENVTREAIAERAGVSVRTFSNYFAGKYDAIAYRQTERVRRSLAAFRERSTDEPLWEAVEAAVLQPLEIDGVGETLPTAAELAEARKVMLVAEARWSISKATVGDWVDAIAERTGLDPVRDIYPRLVVGVIGAVVEAAMDGYVNADPPVHVTTLLRQGFANVAAGLPVPPIGGFGA
ncbi:TetR family transcriptional regulator [soil metagenome]